MYVCAYVCMYEQGPFGSRGHSSDALKSSDAVDWLHICSGRGHDQLGNADVLAARSLSSRQSVVRSQLVVAHGLQQHMFKEIRHLLGAVDTRLSVVVLKRVWDDTALRLATTEQLFRTLLGDSMSDEAVSLQRRGRGG